jgi:hypothetical protein
MVRCSESSFSRDSANAAGVKRQENALKISAIKKILTQLQRLGGVNANYFTFFATGPLNDSIRHG